MSETEDAATTVARLLRTRMRVTKDDDALANVSVTSEWQNSEALKKVDGQVTVGLAESSDQKIDLSGKTRRQTHFLRVKVWSTDAPGTSEPARVMRCKIVDEVIRVLRQNRPRPNVTVYDFIGIGATALTHKAYHGNVEASPYAQGWTGLSEADYSKLWFSDDECSSRAKASVASLKSPAERLSLRSTVVDYGSSPLLLGDTIHVALPNEGVDADFRVANVEYNVDAKTQTLETTFELGKEAPMVAD